MITRPWVALKLLKFKEIQHANFCCPATCDHASVAVRARFASRKSCSIPEMCLQVFCSKFDNDYHALRLRLGPCTPLLALLLTWSGQLMRVIMTSPNRHVAVLTCVTMHKGLTPHAKSTPLKPSATPPKGGGRGKKSTPLLTNKHANQTKEPTPATLQRHPLPDSPITAAPTNVWTGLLQGS